MHLKLIINKLCRPQRSQKIHDFFRYITVGKIGKNASEQRNLLGDLHENVINSKIYDGLFQNVVSENE